MARDHVCQVLRAYDDGGCAHSPARSAAVREDALAGRALMSLGVEAFDTVSIIGVSASVLVCAHGALYRLQLTGMVPGQHGCHRGWW